MKIITIIGARPQFIKAALVSKRLAEQPEVEEHLLHTGQHYDACMSQVFFDQMRIPRPKYRLEVGSGTHGLQTGKMLIEIEKALLEEKPDAVLVYGDTNSTLAGALAASKLHIPVLHVEAGLRSYNTLMPEETNRVLTDHLASMLFCPTEESVKNLAAEGLAEKAHLIGDVMYDSALFFSEEAKRCCNPLAEYELTAGNYALLTCHRAENTDNPEKLAEIQQGIRAICQSLPTLFPVHPRMNNRLELLQQDPPANLQMVAPVSYLDMLELTRNAAVVVTDSGGLQKEAFFFGVPCVTMRDETEWTETVELKANLVVGADAKRIAEAVEIQSHLRGTLPDAGPYYGEGRAAAAIAELIVKDEPRVKGDLLCTFG
ncbi:MAG: UDP-N-acetylglucosamine 2-epimerase (non-hydrolyzing) [Pirellulales bacterium]|nr:UDP-N-acetylglucosamine 2-epimerase (non-hydrolyzing) [Pirellulales bacterium]